MSAVSAPQTSRPIAASVFYRMDAALIGGLAAGIPATACAPWFHGRPSLALSVVLLALLAGGIVGGIVGRSRHRRFVMGAVLNGLLWRIVPLVLIFVLPIVARHLAKPAPAPAWVAVRGDFDAAVADARKKIDAAEAELSQLEKEIARVRSATDRPLAFNHMLFKAAPYLAVASRQLGALGPSLDREALEFKALQKPSRSDPHFKRVRDDLPRSADEIAQTAKYHRDELARLLNDRGPALQWNEKDELVTSLANLYVVLETQVPPLAAAAQTKKMSKLVADISEERLKGMRFHDQVFAKLQEAQKAFEASKELDLSALEKLRADKDFGHDAVRTELARLTASIEAWKKEIERFVPTTAPTGYNHDPFWAQYGRAKTVIDRGYRMADVVKKYPNQQAKYDSMKAMIDQWEGVLGQQKKDFEVDAAAYEKASREDPAAKARLEVDRPNTLKNSIDTWEKTLEGWDKEGVHLPPPQSDDPPWYVKLHPGYWIGNAFGWFGDDDSKRAAQTVSIGLQEGKVPDDALISDALRGATSDANRLAILNQFQKDADQGFRDGKMNKEVRDKAIATIEKHRQAIFSGFGTIANQIRKALTDNPNLPPADVRGMLGTVENGQRVFENPVEKDNVQQILQTFPTDIYDRYWTNLLKAVPYKGQPGEK